MLTTFPSHRARIQAAKRLANKSAAAISEILGIAPTPLSVSSTPPSGSLTPITPTDNDLPLEKLTTSTKSVADYFKEKLGAKSSSNTPAKNDDDSTSRGGIGSSASSRDDVDQPRIGLGAGFGEGRSSNVFAQFFNTSTSSHATVVQMASSATQAIIQPPEPTASSSTDNSRDEEMTEKQRRKAQRKEERKRRDAEADDVPAGVGVEIPDNDAKADKKKKKEGRKAKGAELSDLVPSAVVEESEEGLESEKRRDKKKKKAKSGAQATTEQGENRTKKSKKRTELANDGS
jgi:Pin2-interacting protein X1